MKILSLFDGMSVAQQALKEAGIPVEVYYASEIDEYAMAVTQSNFPQTFQLGNVCKIGASTFMNMENRVDLMIGGSPCQDLSIAKKGREGLSGARSGLFWEYLRIRDEVQPEYFILENVASMPKEAKDTISEALGVQPVMINASLVSAQNRKRLFWIGKWNGEKYEQVEIPQPDDRGILLKDILESDVDEKYFVEAVALRNRGQGKKPEYNGTGRANSLTTVQTDSMVRIGSLNSGGQGDRIYSEQGKSVALSANGGGRGAKTGLYAVSVSEQVIGRKRQPDGSFKRHLEPRDDNKSSALTSNLNRSLIAEETQIRKLTPTECLRLQSMPDDYFDTAEYKGKPISNTQRYKMCGNAFNKEVIVHILKNMLKL